MVTLDLDHEHLYDVYCKEIRSILEYGVPVWHPGLTQNDTMTIERIQKVAFKMILKEKFVDYTSACLYFNTTTLKQNKKPKLCLNFAPKNIKSENSFFDLVSKTVNTSSANDRVKTFKCRTRRFERSSLPYMAKLLNNQ